MTLHKTRNPTSTAAAFLRRCFASGETVALLLRRDIPGQTLQRIVSLDTALAPRYLGWLVHQNCSGANIHVSANPLRMGSHKRTKACIAAIRHLYLDLDSDGQMRLAALRASDDVPPMNAIISTSPGKYQVLWRVEAFTLEQQESTLKHLALTFGGDPACTDCNRLLRLPGFLNCKYDPPCPVTVEYPNDSTWSPGHFRLNAAVAGAALSARTIPSRKHRDKRTNSEHDWAWVRHLLTNGEDASEVTRMLASRRADKQNPLYYAQRTVDIASAKLWLLEGIPIEDVATMLEVRRRFELPAALGRARAREIAQTAQRMIARRETA
jgi:hypothetical protein